MQCPFCKAPDTRVIDSRLAEDGTQVRRRRQCETCDGRFTTFEKAQLQMPNIIKRSGDPEPYAEDKLRRGIESACYKRPVTAEQMDHAIESVERKLRASTEREVRMRLRAPSTSFARRRARRSALSFAMSSREAKR